MKKIAAAALLLVAPVGAWAGGIDLSLSSETANLVYLFNNDPLNRARQPTDDGGSELAAGVFFNDDDAQLAHATLLARGYRQAANTQYFVGAGMRLIGGSIEIDDNVAIVEDDESVGALALGFQAGMLLLPADFNPVELIFEGFYAPGITSFSDAERYGEVSVKLQIEIMTRARAYIGYRRMRFDTDNFDNITVDRNAHFGLNISF